MAFDSENLTNLSAKSSSSVMTTEILSETSFTPPSQASVSDFVKTFKVREPPGQVVPKSKVLDDRDLHAAMSAANVDIKHLTSIRNCVTNSIALGSKSQQESEVYIALLTLRKIIHDGQLDSALLRTLDESVAAAKSTEEEGSEQSEGIEETVDENHQALPATSVRSHEEVPVTQGKILTLPEEILAMIFKDLFTSDGRRKIKITPSLTLICPEDYAILLTCKDLKKVGIKVYYQFTKLEVEALGLTAFSFGDWQGNKIWGTKIKLEDYYDTNAILANPRAFPNLRCLELDLGDNTGRWSGDDYFRVHQNVSLLTLKSNAMEIFTSRKFLCGQSDPDYDGDIAFVSFPDLASVVDHCRSLRSKIPEVVLKFAVECSHVQCLERSHVEHIFFALYKLSFDDPELLKIVEPPLWDEDVPADRWFDDWRNCKCEEMLRSDTANDSSPSVATG